MDTQPLFNFHLTRRMDSYGFSGMISTSRQPQRDGLTLAAIAYMLSSQAMLLEFDHSQNEHALSAAIDSLEQLIPLVSDTHSEKYGWCWTLAGLYMRRYAIHKDPDDCKKAILFYRASVTMAPDFYADCAEHLHQVGLAYLEHHLTPHGNPTDVESAETFLKRAIGSYMGSEPLDIWHYLGLTLGRRYEYSGSLEDLNQSVAVFRLAASKCTDDVLRKRENLSLLSYLLALRYQHEGNEQDVEELDVIIREAAVGSRNQAFITLARSYSLLQRFRHSGRPAELDEAVSILRKVTDEPDLALSLRSAASSYLGMALRERFVQFRDPKDQEASLSALRESAKEGVLNKCGSLADLLSHLSSGHATRFDYTHDPDDLDEAIGVARQAIEATQEGHWAKHTRWGDLGALLRKRYLSYKRMEDLEESHTCSERALRDLPDDHCDKAKLLRYLGHSYMDRFSISSQAKDIDRAVEFHLAAVQATPTDFPERVLRLCDLGNSFLVRFGMRRDLTDANQIISVFKTAALLDKGSFFFRMRASWHWAWSEALWGEKVEASGRASSLPNPEHAECYQALSRMMDLVPLAVWLGDSIAVRYSALKETSVLIRHAATLILRHYGESVQAIEWLEQGRSVVWRQQLNLRTHFDQLQEVEPALAARMRVVSSALDSANTHQCSDEPVPQPGELLIDELGPPRRRLAEEWESLLLQAQQVPGFERLLQPKKLSELRKAARVGPIVMFNEGISHDALIVLEERLDVLHVPLLLPYGRAEWLHATLSDLLIRSNARSRLVLDKHDYCWPDSQEMRRILLCIWIEIVKPVLTALNFRALDTSEVHPRIIWCPTGPFAFLPIHAAGDYSREEPGHRTSDYVVSSYTTTISALLDTSGRPPSSEFRCLAVSQSDTPGLSSLPHTQIEAQRVNERVGPKNVEELTGEAATVAAVHDAMERCSWIHLACHAVQDSTDPLKSAFCLADGRLQLQDIIRKTHPHADFAFLSACQTSTGDHNLADEAVHLAAGMQLAGYRSIIATMWSIGDEDGPLVADEIYSHLLCDSMPDSSRAAHALHNAVLKLQETTKPEDRDDSWFLRWVPFIHIGA